VIPRLPEPYVRHLVTPQGVGDVTLAQAAGEVGSMVGGSGVRVTLAWRDAGRGRAIVAEALARVLGSHALVAPASALVGLVVGLDHDAAARVAAADLERELCGPDAGAAALPAAVVRALEVVEEAWQRALGVGRNGRPADPLGMGLLVCRCLGVGDRQVRHAVRHGAWTPEAVGERCRAGTGCRSCRPDVLALIDEETLPPTAAPDGEADPVARIVWARAGRELRSLGMGLQEVRVDADGVAIRVEALRQKPDTTDLSAVAIVRHVLRETVAPQIPVRLLV
jgi:bacterioferritin-associated ferredoxin